MPIRYNSVAPIYKMKHLTNRELMELQAETLFVQNGRKQLISINEPVPHEQAPAPLLFIGTTNEGNICRFRHDLPAYLSHSLETVIKNGAGNLLADNFTLFNQVTEQLLANGYHIEQCWIGPAYHFPAATLTTDTAIAINASNADTLQKHFPYTFANLKWLQPCAAIIVEGNAVSICRTVRRSPQAAEAGADTIPTMQQRGYGAKVVAKWAWLAQRMGIRPLYSTASSNIASQKLAAKLGLLYYGFDFHLSEGNKCQ